MADGAPGLSPAEMGLTQEDLGIKPDANTQAPIVPKTPTATPVITLQKPPSFIREFSKAGSSEERSALASQISEKRTEHFTKKAEKSGKEAELMKALEDLAATEAAFDEIPDSWFGRVLKHKKLSELRSQLGSQEEINHQIRGNLSATAYSESRLQEAGMQVTRLDQARSMVNKFYESEKEKWADSDYKREDVQKLFSEEHLSSLSTEDYIALLRRFPSDMVTHVTRQGVRDHTGITEHNSGVGQFTNGFNEILADGRLRSILGTYTKDGVSQEAILNLLEI